MSAVATAVVGSAVIGGYVSSQAAGEAADAQTASAQAGIDAQNAQFAATQEVLSPYVDAGNAAISGQGDLLGLNGQEAQQAAYAGIENGAGFQAQVQQGEDAMLQNAAATGGLRGGNTQGALAQYRPQMLQQAIQSQLGNLGGIAGLGQASAAGVGAAGQNSANQISALHGQAGQAQAGAALAQGQAINGVVQGVGNIGTMAAMGAF